MFVTKPEQRTILITGVLKQMGQNRKNIICIAGAFGLGVLTASVFTPGFLVWMLAVLVIAVSIMCMKP